MIKNMWVWERAATLHLMISGSRSCGKPHTKEWGVSWPMDCGIFRDGMAKFVSDLDRLKEAGREIIEKYFLDEETYKEKMRRWEVLCGKLVDIYKKNEKINLTELSNDELHDLYVDFDDFYDFWWGFAIAAEPIAYGAEAMIKEALTEEQIKKYFNILVSPTTPSYHNEEEEKLFEIILKIREKKEALELFKKEIKEIVANLGKFPQIKKMIEKHVKEYFWLQNNYYETFYLDKEYFISSIKDYLKDNVDTEKIKKGTEENLIRTKEEKERVIEELKLEEKTRKIVWLIDDFCSFQDHRKKLDLVGHHYYDMFCKEAARRADIPIDIFRFTTPELLKASLKGKNVEEEVKKLTGNVVLLIDNSGYKILTGKEALKKEEELLGKKEEIKVDEIEGMCASGGRVTGKVRKLLTPKDMGKMQKGDILVTTMTSPDFVPAMKRASGIVTDEGGITSHAAIVSRELGIPCVIGTKIATQVLNDGDIIEVKANHGLVHILERKK